MTYIFRYDLTKHVQLLEERGVGFEDIIEAISEGNLIDVIEHPSEKYPNQQLFVALWQDYTYIIPCVPEWENTYFMKTIIPSRKYHKLYNPSHHA